MRLRLIFPSVFLIILLLYCIIQVDCDSNCQSHEAENRGKLLNKAANFAKKGISGAASLGSKAVAVGAALGNKAVAVKTNLGNKAVAIKTNLGKGAVAVGTALGSKAVAVGAALGNKAVDVGVAIGNKAHAVGNLAVGVGAGLVNKGVAIGGALVNKGVAVGTAIGNKAGAIGAHLGSKASIVGTALGNKAGAIGAHLGSKASIVGNLAVGVGAHLGSKANAVGNLALGVGAHLGGKANAVGNLAVGVGGALINKGVAIGGALVNKAGAIGGALVNKGLAVGGAAVGLANLALQKKAALLAHLKAKKGAIVAFLLNKGKGWPPGYRPPPTIRPIFTTPKGWGGWGHPPPVGQTPPPPPPPPPPSPTPHGWIPPTTTKGWGAGAKPSKAIIPKTPAKDCCEIQKQGYKKCGVYQITPTSGFKTTVYCDLAEDGGGWTLLMRREPSDGPTTNFYVTENSYELGFGNPATTYWLGLKSWVALTENKDQELKVCLEDFYGEKYQGSYNYIFVDPTNDYMLTFDGFSGNMENSLESHNNSKFYAPDNDRSEVGCAQLYKAGWWWHQECYDVLLTGNYKSESEAAKLWSDQDSDYGLTWASVTKITDPEYPTDHVELSLKYVIMKIRGRDGCGGGGNVSPGGGGGGGPGHAETILAEYSAEANSQSK